MVLQSFLYLLVPLNRAELTRVNYYEFLKSSTTPCRKKSPAPVNGLKGHLHNILQEISELLSPAHRQTITQTIETTITETSSGAHLRVALIKVYLKLKDIDSNIQLLLGTLVKISELVYLPESRRTPIVVLQMYNTTWLHHELCCQLIPSPKSQTREKFYSKYLYDLVVNAPTQLQMVCLCSTNAESTERLFSQIKHISQSYKQEAR